MEIDRDLSTEIDLNADFFPPLPPTTSRDGRRPPAPTTSTFFSSTFAITPFANTTPLNGLSIASTNSHSTTNFDEPLSSSFSHPTSNSTMTAQASSTAVASHSQPQSTQRTSSSSSPLKPFYTSAIGELFGLVGLACTAMFIIVIGIRALRHRRAARFSAGGAGSEQPEVESERPSDEANDNAANDSLLGTNERMSAPTEPSCIHRHSIGAQVFPPSYLEFLPPRYSVNTDAATSNAATVARTGSLKIVDEKDIVESAPSTTTARVSGWTFHHMGV